MLGVLFGICSSVSTALHAIVIKKSLDVVKGDTMELVYYNNLLSAIAFTPVILLAGEQKDVFALFFGSDPTALSDSKDRESKKMREIDASEVLEKGELINHDNLEGENNEKENV
ncbi:10239_t:CDS:2 [Racocetra fulgida]|uniref:10239_t:CDS:1 n=1 Tax=Racocetra fulgida TaxID=60492 RepID=A0A9N9B0D0_9GLOM|nr:10239_t:CDS:2 [Racocetra fulgida]